MTPKITAGNKPGSSVAETGLVRQEDAMQMLMDDWTSPDRIDPAPHAQAITPRHVPLPAPPYPHPARLEHARQARGRR